MKTTKLAIPFFGALMTVAMGCPDTSSDGGDSNQEDAIEDEDEVEPEAEPENEPDANGFDFIDEDKIMEHVNYLASDDLEGRDEGTSGGVNARRYIIGSLEDCGVLPQNDGDFTQEITTGAGTNIIGMIPGTGDSDRVVMASAHFDHLGVDNGSVFNGAMDNAAAVGALIQMACGFAADPAPKTVVVAFWDSEEPPTFLTEAMGSAFYGANPTLDLGNIDASIVMDLLGGGVWNGYQEHVGFGTEYSPEVRAAFESARDRSDLKPFIGGLHLFEATPQGHLPLSDYDAFRNRGVPVVFLTDGTNKRYHTPNDTADLLDTNKLYKEGQFLYNLVDALAHSEENTTFNAEGADYLADAVMLDALLNDAVTEMADAVGISAGSQGSLENDAAAVKAVRTRLESGGAAQAADIQTLRTGMQRVQCLGGSTYPEYVCNLF